jgi:hypothetical protein
MVRSCLTQRKNRYKKNTSVFSNIYTILQHLTAFDNSPEKNVELKNGDGHEYMHFFILPMLNSSLQPAFLHV